MPREQIWIAQVAGPMLLGKALVVIANKQARRLWVMLTDDKPATPMPG